MSDYPDYVAASAEFYFHHSGSVQQTGRQQTRRAAHLRVVLSIEMVVVVVNVAVMHVVTAVVMVHDVCGCC